jgi:hypothetical protein
MTEVSLEINADSTGVEAAMKRAQEAVVGGVEAMKGSIESLNGAFEAINGIMLAFTAVLAGGAGFKEAVNASVNAAIGAEDLGRQLGITASQASVLKIAMDENRVPMEAVTGAANKIAAAIKKNPEEFARLGVAIRDSNGNMRSSLDIMEDVNTKLAGMKEGTARNVEGQRIYGKSWEAIAPSLRLTTAAMDEAQEKAESLNLVVGKEGIAQAEAYRKAMAGVHTVFDGIEKAIGDAMLPMLTRLAQWFNSVGPQAVQVVKGSLVALVAVFENLMAVGITVTQTLTGLWEGLGRSIQLVFEVLNGFLTKGPAGAKEAWDRNFAEIENAAKQRAANIAQAWKDAAANVDQFAERTAKHDTPTQDAGGKNDVQDDNAGKSRTQGWENELAQKKIAYQEDAAAHGQLLEFSKAQEIEYWQAILATTRVSSEEKKQIISKIANDQLAIEKSRLEGSLAILKNEEAEHGQNLTARLAAEQKYAESVKQIYGATSKQYADAEKTITATHEAMIQQQRKIDDIQIQSDRNVQLAAISNAAAAAKEQYDMKRIGLTQLIALEEQYQQQKYQLELKAAAAELAIVDPNTDPVAYAQKLGQIRQLATQNQSEMLKISQQSNQQEIALAKTLQTTLQNGFQQAFEGIIKKTMTVHQAFTKMLDGILSSVLTTVSKMIAQWVEQAAINMLTNKQQTLANAGTAASGAMASASAIPVVGWALAPIVGAAVYAAALGYSAKGGYDVPAGLNPQTQLHEKEMVLPQPIADPLRQAIASGQLGGGGGSDPSVHITAMDSRSVEKALSRNGSLQKAMRNLHRRMKR